jgi:cyanoexosortase B-associated protein
MRMLKLKPVSLKLLLMLALALLIALGTLPGYLQGGKWAWQSPPKVTTLAQLKALRDKGLAIANWQTTDKQTPLIGEHKWLKQDLISGDQKAILLLFPQNGPIDQPQVEWADINGTLTWRTDSDSLREVTPSVKARYFRGWNDQQTYAVLQWYAWSEGGDPAPSRWFIVDRLAQLQHRRAAWVAISLLLPTEPLDDIEKYWSKMNSLAQTVQSNLMDVLRSQ